MGESFPVDYAQKEPTLLIGAYLQSFGLNEQISEFDVCGFYIFCQLPAENEHFDRFRCLRMRMIGKRPLIFVGKTENCLINEYVTQKK